MCRIACPSSTSPLDSTSALPTHRLYQERANATATDAPPPAKRVKVADGPAKKVAAAKPAEEDDEEGANALPAHLTRPRTVAEN